MPETSAETFVSALNFNSVSHLPPLLPPKGLLRQRWWCSVSVAFLHVVLEPMSSWRESLSSILCSLFIPACLTLHREYVEVKVSLE